MTVLLLVPAAVAAIWVGTDVAGTRYALPYALLLVAIVFLLDRLDRPRNRVPR